MGWVPPRGSLGLLRERKVPVVSIDFAYLGDGEEDKLFPITVGKDSSSSYLLVEPLLTKHNLRTSARGLRDYLVSLGYSQVVVQSDQEPALMALRGTAVRMI